MSSNSIVSSPKGGETTYNFNCYKNTRAHLCINLAPYLIGQDKDHGITTLVIANKIATVASIIFSYEKDVSEAEFQGYLGCVMNNLEDCRFKNPHKVKTIIEKIMKKPDLSSSSSSSPLSLQVPKASFSSAEESLEGQSAGSRVPADTSPSPLPVRDIELGLGLGLPPPSETGSIICSSIVGRSHVFSEGSLDPDPVENIELRVIAQNFCDYYKERGSSGSYSSFRKQKNGPSNSSTSNSSMSSFFGTYMKPFVLMLGALFAFLVVCIKKNRT